MRFGGKAGDRRTPLNPDAEIIRELAGLLAETGLTEIEYAVGDHRIRVAREPTGVGSGVANTNGHSQAHVAPPVSAQAAAAPASANSADHPGVLPSPMVGVAYLAPEPGATPFVRIGDAVSKGQTLLIIEAMKVMNQIRAPQDGRVTKIFITDTDPVEYGAPLMLIE